MKTHRGKFLPFALVLTVLVFILSAIPLVTAGSFTNTGSMSVPRYAHTATLLLDGKVLVAGGLTNSIGVAISSAELYDPATGTWATTGSLNTARQKHTATLLPNGQVLVAGGATILTHPIFSAELYDPASGTWTTTKPLNFPRVQHTATLLPNGTVLVAGGESTNGVVNSAELYDPTTGIWTAIGSMNQTRFQHTATLLSNGMVLVAAGKPRTILAFPYAALSSTELFDPATGVWTDTGSLNTSRTDHTATLLPNGLVLVASGINTNGSPLFSAELYDPNAGTWTATNSLKFARENHTATLLPNGQVLVAGGAGSSGVLSAAELFDPNTGAWTTTSPLNTAREEHTATLLPDGRVLVAGGTVGTNALSSAELYISPTPPILTGATVLQDGSFQFDFTNTPGASFGALMTTDPSVPLTNWMMLGGVMEISPGQFQFIDSAATNSPQRFYIIRSQ